MKYSFTFETESIEEYLKVVKMISKKQTIHNPEEKRGKQTKKLHEIAKNIKEANQHLPYRDCMKLASGRLSLEQYDV